MENKTTEDRGHNYWETLYSPADDAIEKLMLSFEIGGITPVEVFSKIRDIEVDFYPETDVCKETINKVIDFMVETGVADDIASAAYHTAQAEDKFQKLTRQNPGAIIKFYILETYATGTTQWKFQDTEDETKRNFDGFIKYWGKKANSLELFKALVIELDGNKPEIIHEEVIHTYKTKL